MQPASCTIRVGYGSHDMPDSQINRAAEGFRRIDDLLNDNR